MWMFLACFLSIGCQRLENTFLVATRLKRQTIKGSIGESQGNGIESLKVVCKPVLQPWNFTFSLLQTILDVSNTQYSTLWLTKPWKASLLILLTIIFPWKGNFYLIWNYSDMIIILILKLKRILTHAYYYIIGFFPRQGIGIKGC